MSDTLIAVESQKDEILIFNTEELSLVKVIEHNFNHLYTSLYIDSTVWFGCYDGVIKFDNVKLEALGQSYTQSPIKHIIALDQNTLVLGPNFGEIYVVDKESMN